MFFAQQIDISWMIIFLSFRDGALGKLDQENGFRFPLKLLLFGIVSLCREEGMATNRLNQSRLAYPLMVEYGKNFSTAVSSMLM